YERLSARRALQIGLVQEVVPLDQVVPRAQELAARIAASPPLVVQGTIRSIWLARELPHAQAVEMAKIYIGLGSDLAQIAEYQKLFESKKRVEWELR